MSTDVKNLSSNAFKTVLEIDTLGAYNTLKATIPHLKESKGSILFVSATLHYRGTVMQAHVSAAKAAIDALSQVVTVEYGPYGVRSNVISPGGIAGTEGIERLMPKEVTEQATKAIPLGRLGTVEDIAECTGISSLIVTNIVFIFSEAGKYISGTVFIVDGGAWHQYFSPCDWLIERSSITEQFPYPEIVLQSKHDLNVTGKKKSKL